MTTSDTPTLPMWRGASHSGSVQARQAMAQYMHLSEHHQPEPDMSSHSMLSAAAATVRALRKAGMHSQARRAAYEARMRIGATLLRRCIA